MTENYPRTISAPPVTVKGHRVLAWAELAQRAGNYPGGIVLVYGGSQKEYVTWIAYTKDGGATWEATSGYYTREYDAAWESFVTRCRTGLATS